MLGAVDRGHAVRLVEALAAHDGAALIAAVDGLRELGLSAAGTLEEMAALLQEMAVLQAVPGADDSDDPDAAVAARLAALLPADETQLLYSIVLHGRAELPLAPDEYSGLVMVLLRMLAFAPADAAAEAACRGRAPAPRRGAARRRRRRRRAARRGRAGSGALPSRDAGAALARRRRRPPPRRRRAMRQLRRPPTPASPRPRRRPLPRDRAAADRWVELVRRLIEAGSIAAMVRELAMQAEGIAVVEAAGETLWRLRVERENLRAPALREKLQAARGRGRCARRCGSSSRPARRSTRRPSAPPRRDAAPGRGRAGDPRRSAGQGPAGAVQDRAHRSRLGQTVVNFQELKP